MGDALETPALKKGAAFIFKYQAVTSERESKVRVFSPFPQMPEINLTQVHTLLKSKGNTDSLEGMNSVKSCRSAAIQELYGILFDRLEEKLDMLEKEIIDDKIEKRQLVKIATSFVPPNINPKEQNNHRGRRAVGLIAAAAGAAGLVLGNPIKEAACSALSIFTLCNDNWDRGRR